MSAIIIDNWRWYEPAPILKMPHMSTKDMLVVNQFLASNQNYFKRITFDITVGQGRGLIGAYPDNYLDDWEYLSKLKIDCILDDGSSLFITEVKPIIMSNAVGQVLVYTYWLLKQVFYSVPVKRALMGFSIHPDVKQYCDDNDITVFLAPAPVNAELPREPRTRTEP